jgi:hypothetical protein
VSRLADWLLLLCDPCWVLDCWTAGVLGAGLLGAGCWPLLVLALPGLRTPVRERPEQARRRRMRSPRPVARSRSPQTPPAPARRSPIVRKVAAPHRTFGASRGLPDDGKPKLSYAASQQKALEQMGEEVATARGAKPATCKVRGWGWRGRWRRCPRAGGGGSCCNRTFRLALPVPASGRSRRLHGRAAPCKHALPPAPASPRCW